MKQNKMLSVFIENKKVGTLAENSSHLTAFEYDEEWINTGFSLSPLSLPLRKQVFVPDGYDPFEGTFGVFSDSLPDGWGRLLVDRMLKNNGVNPAEVGTLDRLAIVGSSGMGALSYYPEENFEGTLSEKSFDELAEECKLLMETNDCSDVDELFRLGGSSGGARPKVNYNIDGEEWIVKFASSHDIADIGLLEYEYSVCAKDCGIYMEETRLMPSKLCTGYFATRRFDRNGQKRIHMISASALLETSHRIPNLDYNILMQLTLKLTNDYSQLEQLFRLMCFNVFAHNRDDHSKNFSYIYDESESRWRLSPAYDLTYSNSIGGEHATTINGNGKNPDIDDLLAVAGNAKLDIKKARAVALDIKEKVQTDLKKWL